MSMVVGKGSTCFISVKIRVRFGTTKLSRKNRTPAPTIAMKTGYTSAAWKRPFKACWCSPKSAKSFQDYIKGTGCLTGPHHVDIYI